jgi:Chitinase
MMGLASAVMTTMLVLSSPQTTAATAEKQSTKAKIARPMLSAYVYDRATIKLYDRDAPYLSQMNYSFALLEDGKVTDKHWTGIKKFQAFMKKHPHILPVLAVGGWGAEGFCDVAASDESRKIFAQSAVELMEKHGFLGLDIDWEYPASSVAGIKSSPDDKWNFTLLLRELRYTFDACEKQDGKHRYLAIAVGGSAAYAEKLELGEIAKIVDQVNVMTYDLRGFEKTTGHHTNLYPDSADAVQSYIAGGIPANKIMLGAAFYGHAWRNVKGEGTGLNQRAETSGNKTYSYDQIRQFLASGEYTLHWDESAMAHSLFDGSTFISFESSESIAQKGKYAMNTGLQGVMFWEYNHDTTGELLKGLYDSLH